MAGKRALFVGINKFAKYPHFALNGCVNDVKDMTKLYREVLGFKASEIQTLTDAQATKAAIMKALGAMVADAKAGKLSALVFAMSSHGTQMRDADGDEADGADEAFVPYDIAEKAGKWDPKFIISDDEFNQLFSSLPPSVLLEVYLDTCHSGTGLRGAEFGPHAPRPRFIAPPEHEFGKKFAEPRAFSLNRSIAATSGKPAAQAKKTSAAVKAKDTAGAHHVLWTGCKSNQTSADAYFDGRYNGAFTYQYCKAIRACNNQSPRKQVIKEIRKALKGKFTQVPQLEGNASNRDSVVIY